MYRDTGKYPALNRGTTITESLQDSADAIHDFQVNWLRRCGFNKVLLHVCLLMPFWFGLLVKGSLPTQWHTVITAHSWGYLLIYVIARTIIYAVYDSVIQARATRYAPSDDYRTSTTAMCFVIIAGSIVAFYWILYGMVTTPTSKIYKGPTIEETVPPGQQKEPVIWREKKVTPHQW